MISSFYLVAGLGKTGLSVARYLQRRNLPFMLFDTRSSLDNGNEVFEEFSGVDIFLNELPAAILPQLTTVIASPGVPLDHPVMRVLRQYDLPIIGDIECLAREIKAPVIAITGTNGKSTVTSLVGEMAKAAGLSTAVAGNIGLPVLDLLDDGHHYDLWVLELSSFQLDLIESLAPVAAALLNISPDHLDRHHSLAAYIAAKQRVYHQAELAVYNRNDAQTAPENANKMISFGLKAPTGQQWGIIQKEGRSYLARGEICFLDIEQLALKGTHNWQNAMAACALAFAAGIDEQCIRSVLQTFSGLPHRCQWVRTLDQVAWINDSKGTNIGASQSAISGIGANIDGKIVLIAGGLGKGADFKDLQFCVRNYVRCVLVIGTDGPLIAAALSELVPVYSAASLEEAILSAKKKAQPKDVVLLSPACASQDMFRDFNHRGESFIQWVEAL